MVCGRQLLCVKQDLSFNAFVGFSSSHCLYYLAANLAYSKYMPIFHEPIRVVL